MRYQIHRFLFCSFALFFFLQKKSDGKSFDTLKVLTEAQQLAYIHSLYENTLQYYDSVSFYTSMKELQDLAAHNRQDKRLQTWIVILNGYYCEDHPQRPHYADALQYYTQALEMTRTYRLEYLEPEIMHRMGVLLYNNRNYKEAFSYMMYAREKIEDLGYTHYPNTGRFLNDLGFYYLEFGFYEKAIVHLKEATKYKFARFDLALYCYKSLGKAYEALNNIDSALYCYEKALGIAKEIENILWEGKLAFLVGNIYFNQKKYDKAIPLIKEGYRLCMETATWCTAANALIVQAEISMDHDMATAGTLLTEARSLATGAGTSEQLALYRELYKSLARYYRLKNDPAQALLFLDSFMIYRDTITSLRDALLLRDSEVKTEIEKQQSEIILLKSERQRQILLRNAIILASFLLLVIGLLQFRQMRLKREKDRKLLLSYVESLKEKSQLVDQFKTELEHLQATPDNPVQPEKMETLQKLRDSTILTEQDWKEFRQLFDKVHKGFFIRLQEKYPTLSQAEIRLLALIKLNLSSREIADMLGISPDSVRKTRQRVRERLNIEELKLEEFVKGV